MKKLLLPLIALLLQITAHAQIITTVAGGGSFGLGDGGAATDCQLYDPTGIAVDASGNLYIADRDGHRIRKVNTAGTVTTIAGTGTAGYWGDGGPATLARLNEPAGLAIDAAGNIYFSEVLNNCVRKINTSGIIQTVAGTGISGYDGDEGPATNAKISGPGYIAIDPSGNIYIPEYDNHCVRKIDIHGIIHTVAGINSPGYSGDESMATDAKLRNPEAVAVDAHGNIYIADFNNNRIRKVDLTGIISTVAGTGIGEYNGDNIAATNASLNKPFGLAIDNAGNLYVGDVYNKRVRKIAVSGMITTVAGTGDGPFAGDGGPATLAKFQTITGIAVDAPGNIYVCDMGSDRVRKITAPVAVPVTKKNTNEKLTVYPNPCNGNFTINIQTSEIDKVSVRLINSTGNTLKEETVSTNDLVKWQTDVPPGIYLITAVINGLPVSEKLNIIP